MYRDCVGRHDALIVTVSNMHAPICNCKPTSESLAFEHLLITQPCRGRQFRDPGPVPVLAFANTPLAT